ncbi:hypothetical protein RM780_04140 [Streptomyces sp. DSM 44917]|uniref:Uncharacterized protein n=1 Tax=Streptomyces boetiae TaxID=3075541 RepID=A0ABU2L3L5_9ACTN|nr:hypothetical protein [Streptomyces sp. DSM 44917]MDT0306152.1 hypothetical protein [Streptomyces sp. DSM 44917]
MPDLSRLVWNPAARYPLLVQLSGGRVRHYARQARAGGSSVVTPCRKSGAVTGDGAGLPVCAACARRPNPISQQTAHRKETP